MIVIRAAAADDAVAILGSYGPYVASSAVSFETEVPTLDEMRVRLTGSDGLYPCTGASGTSTAQWRNAGTWQRDLAAAANPPEEPKRFVDVGVVRDS